MGLVYGMIFGAIPGLSSEIALITLIPFAFVMPITHSLVLMAAGYCGGTFGGAFTAILVNIPGAPESVCTTFDGYPMAKKGLAGKALGAAITSSAIGGMMGALVFIFVAPSLADFALSFGDADYFGVIVMGLFVVGCISGRSLTKGILSAVLGILLGTIGMSIQSGEIRFTFGSGMLEAGIEFISVMIGVFALGEIFLQFSRILHTGTTRPIGQYTGSKFTLGELWREKINVLRSWILGTVAGFIPGIGATLASFLSYGIAKSISKRPQDFGTGKLAGIVAPETANNAATGGAMIPLLTLGIPGGAATAVMLAVFLSQGLQPGPTIFLTQMPMVGAIMVSLILANALIIPTGRFAVRGIVKLLSANFGYFIALVAVFCIVAGFSIRNMMLDPYTILMCGIISYYWKIHDFPTAPFILGVVLGPMAETHLIRALIQEGDIIGVLTSPIGLVFLLFGSIFLIIPLILSLRKRGGGAQQERPSVHIATPLIYSILIGASAYLFSVTSTWVKPEYSAGPAFWPQIALSGIILLSVINIGRWCADCLKIKKMRSNDMGTIDVSLGRFFLPHGWYTLLPIIIIVVYYGLLNVVGFLVLTLIFIPTTLYIAGMRKPLAMAAFSIGLVAFVSLIFFAVMRLYMPAGEFIFADFHHWAFAMLYSIFG